MSTAEQQPPQPILAPSAVAPEADALLAPSADDRRHKQRLRELCDEVLASHRVAQGNDVLSPEERQEARALLDAFAPRAGKRERAR